MKLSWVYLAGADPWPVVRVFDPVKGVVTQTLSNTRFVTVPFDAGQPVQLIEFGN